MKKHAPKVYKNGTPPANVTKSRRTATGLMKKACSDEEIQLLRLRAAKGEVTLKQLAVETGLSLNTLREKYKIKYRRPQLQPNNVIP